VFECDDFVDFRILVAGSGKVSGWSNVALHRKRGLSEVIMADSRERGQTHRVTRQSIQLLMAFVDLAGSLVTLAGKSSKTHDSHVLWTKYWYSIRMTMFTHHCRFDHGETMHEPIQAYRFFDGICPPLVRTAYSLIRLISGPHAILRWLNRG